MHARQKPARRAAAGIAESGRPDTDECDAARARYSGTELREPSDDDRYVWTDPSASTATRSPANAPSSSWSGAVASVLRLASLSSSIVIASPITITCRARP